MLKIEGSSVAPVLSHGCAPSRRCYLELGVLLFRFWSRDGDSVPFSWESL